MTLVVGLGNPGIRYQMNRHNLGFMVVEALAHKLGWGFSKEAKLEGWIAHGVLADRPLVLLKPMTFMNLSGSSVQKTAHFYKIPPPKALVITDDVYVEFGRLKIRQKGSSGGHKGLESIEHSLQTQIFPRLRVGIGVKNPELSTESHFVLKAFVLEDFSEAEKTQLSQVVERGVAIVEKWISQGVESASRLAGDLSKEPLR